MPACCASVARGIPDAQRLAFCAYEAVCRLLDKVNPKQLEYKVFDHFSICELPVATLRRVAQRTQGDMTSVGGLTSTNLRRRDELCEAERIHMNKANTKRLNRGGYSIEELKALAAEKGEDVEKYLYDVGSKPLVFIFMPL